MDTRVCAHCGVSIEHKHPTAKYCSRSHASSAYMKVWRANNSDKIKQYRDRYVASGAAAEDSKKWREANPDKWKASQARYRQKEHRKEAQRQWQSTYYHNVTAPKGQRLQERLDGLFRAQAALDPSGLPKMASRVLSWRPKGHMAALQYALHPYGPLEADWLYYAEMSPEEAVVCYEAEA